MDGIAEALDVSATPVREGLLTLRGEGFVTQVPRRGFVVAPLSDADVRDLFWVQAQVAGELAARSALTMSAEDLGRARALQRELTAAQERKDLAAVERCNHELHRTINLSAESPKMWWILAIALHYVPSHFFAAILGWQDASVSDHEAILKALAAKDPEASRAAMESHIINAGNLLLAHRDELRQEGNVQEG